MHHASSTIDNIRKEEKGHTQCWGHRYLEPAKDISKVIIPLRSSGGVGDGEPQESAGIVPQACRQSPDGSDSNYDKNAQRKKGHEHHSGFMG